MQVTLPFVSLAFHKVSITSRSFLKAVTEEALLHFLSDLIVSEEDWGKTRPCLVAIGNKDNDNYWHLLYIILAVIFFDFEKCKLHHKKL